MKIHPVLTVLMIVLAATGATFAIACMIFNFVNRKRRLVGYYYIYTHLGNAIKLKAILLFSLMVLDFTTVTNLVYI